MASTGLHNNVSADKLQKTTKWADRCQMTKTVYKTVWKTTNKPTTSNPPTEATSAYLKCVV